MRDSVASNSHQHLVSSAFKILSILVCVEWYITVILFSIPLIISEIEGFFSCSLAIWISYLSFCPSVYWYNYLFSYWFVGILYIFLTGYLYWIHIIKDLLHHTLSVPCQYVQGSYAAWWKLPIHANDFFTRSICVSLPEKFWLRYVLRPWSE